MISKPFREQHPLFIFFFFFLLFFLCPCYLVTTQIKFFRCCLVSFTVSTILFLKNFFFFCKFLFLLMPYQHLNPIDIHNSYLQIFMYFIFLIFSKPNHILIIFSHMRITFTGSRCCLSLLSYIFS